jgi:Fur family transcriptional regulator, ferric uptake regulator
MTTMPADAAAQEFHDEVAQRLKRTDQRYTPGRRAIIEALVEAGGPVSISDIADRLPELPRSSAYRHLVDLQAAGLVRRVAANDEFGRFELAEDLTEHHHHLLCVECGRVLDVTPSAAFERALAEAIDELSGPSGFTPDGHRLDVLGVCGECALR